MRIVFALALSLLVGCAATVPKKDFSRLQGDYGRCVMSLEDQKSISVELQEELNKWKPEDYQIEAANEAAESLTELLSDFTQGFAKFMSNSSGEQVEVKADEIVFIDNYEGALVRLWLRFPDALGKYYLMFVRDQNDKWKYVGYYQVGVIQTGVK